MLKVLIFPFRVVIFILILPFKVILFIIKIPLLPFRSSPERRQIRKYEGPYATPPMDLTQENWGKPGQLCPHCKGMGWIYSSGTAQYAGAPTKVQCPTCSGSGGF